MKPKNKQMLRNYFKAVNIDSIEFNTKAFPYTRLTYVKSFVGLINDWESTGILDKMRAWYPFLDMPKGSHGINVLDEKETRFNFDHGLITNIDLTESDKKELNDFAEKASNSLTRKI
jgi:hypothetical protein